uniref:phage minor head protein n=1 Tax=Escherichia coli TaxID=562 RepID=UPI001F3C9974
LSDYTRQQVAEVITAGIANGDAPGVVEQNIVNRMDVSRSYARSIAQTEITNTLREANRREVKVAQVTLGMDTIMLWQSALMKTTRVTHAARHGKYYTPEEIDE